MEYLKPHIEFELDTILESINESNIDGLERSFNRSDNKLKWYEQLLTKIKTMKLSFKHKILSFIIPLIMSVGVSQGAIVSSTNSIDSEMGNYVEQMDMDMGDKSTSGVQVYFDTTGGRLHRGTVNETFEKTVDHNDTELYFKIYELNGTSGTNIVTLNGNVIKTTSSSILPYVETITAQKGDVFKITISGSQNAKVQFDVTMSADLTVGVETISETDFKIFPNPVESELNVQTDQTDLTYEIYSMDGKLVLPQNRLNKSIDVSGLNSGYYILKLISNKGVSSKRFMKR